jgi:hypothetical protein
MQQLPQGTFAVIVQGSGVYGGIANGSFNTITGGPGPGPGASSGDGVSGGGTGGGNVYILNSQTLVEQGSGLQTDGWTWTLATYYTGAEALCAIYNPWGNGFMDYPAGSDGWAIYRPDGFSITLAEIVQDICEECGLTVDQINVEALAKTIVYGYMISQEASGRAAIEPLQEIYQFDLIEIDGVLTATLRLTETANVNITIEEGDLGARSATAEIGANPQPKVVETRKQDVEIPQYVFLRYRTALGDFYVKNFSFEIATQYAKRAISPISTVYGQAHQSLSSTIVLDDSQAAAAVLNILLLQYINRASFTFSLPIKYIAITAGDVIELSWHDTEGNLVQYPVYIQQVDIGADNTLKCSGVSTLGATYTASTGSGGTISYGGPFALTTWVNPGTGLPSSPGSDTPSNPEVPGQPVTFPGVITMTTGQPTTVDIAETPPLSDSDDTPGFYWGACGSGTSPGWGATFVYSVDGGATYAIIGQEPAPATLGYAVTALGDLGGYDTDLPIPGLWDVTNTLTINTIGGAAGALASVIPVNVLSQQNIFLVGKEIIGAAKITQNTNGSYTLSCLQRGLLGTDIYMASHSVGEKVVYLVADSTIQDYTTPLGFIGSDYDYAGITSGSDISTSSVFQYQIQGTRIRPEAGVHGTIVRDGSNNATITWNPRNRINYQWIDGQEQGTDEAIEAYSVDILSAGGTVLATLTDWEVGTMTIGGTIGADAGVRMVPLPAATQEAIGLVGLGAEWNPSDDHAMTLASANLLATNSGAGNAGVRAISGLTAGKFYIEGMPNSLINNGTGWGIADSVFSLSSGTDINGDTHSVGGNAIGGYLHNGVWSAIAVDLNTGLLWIRGTPTSFWNGSSSADPVAEIGGFPLSSLSGSLRYLVFKSLGGPESLLLNVGGSPFAGAVPSGYAYGWSGPGPAPITAVIYQVSSRVGRGFPYTVSA